MCHCCLNDTDGSERMWPANAGTKGPRSSWFTKAAWHLMGFAEAGFQCTTKTLLLLLCGPTCVMWYWLYKNMDCMKWRMCSSSCHSSTLNPFAGFVGFTRMFAVEWRRLGKSKTLPAGQIRMGGLLVRSWTDLWKAFYHRAEVLLNFLSLEKEEKIKVKWRKARTMLNSGSPSELHTNLTH